LVEPLHDGGVIGRDPSVQDARRAGGGQSPSTQVVFEGYRDAGQRAGIYARSHGGIDLAGSSPGLFSSHQVESVHFGFAGLDGAQVIIDHRAG